MASIIGGMGRLLCLLCWLAACGSALHVGECLYGATENGTCKASTAAAVPDDGADNSTGDTSGAGDTGDTSGAGGDEKDCTRQDGGGGGGGGGCVPVECGCSSHADCCDGYCGPGSLCTPAKASGADCEAPRECESFTCSSNKCT
jgi:hypothetical protein